MTTKHAPILPIGATLTESSGPETIALIRAQKEALDEATKAVALTTDANPSTHRQIAFDVVRAYLRVMRQHEEKRDRPAIDHYQATDR